MLKSLKEKGTQIKWITEIPSCNNIALLIPQYNELSYNLNMQNRLDYFNSISIQYKNSLDVIIIDDGSIDESLITIKKYLRDKHHNLHVASVYPNAQKIGALCLTVLNINHEFIVLSDFDTNLVGLENISNVTSSIQEDNLLMGCYFRMLPHSNENFVFTMQELEYLIARSLYKFHRKDHSVLVMPGAGSLYKNNALKEIYKLHSGLISGEDRESTILGLRLNYKALYEDTITALTIPPLQINSLIKQRVRWNLGYIETVYKENKFYKNEIKKASRLGIRTLLDFSILLNIVFIPIFFLFSGIFFFKVTLCITIVSYFVALIYCIGTLLYSKNELRDIKIKKLRFILLYPFFWIIIDHVSWVRALSKFFWKNTKKSN